MGRVPVDVIALGVGFTPSLPAAREPVAAQESFHAGVTPVATPGLLGNGFSTWGLQRPEGLHYGYS
ncbi:MAG: hypothetical protein H0V62_05890 [Gammaproteobacteria bacterium]|nr:hypothetical protein [Gammaproteobacteria bacterium]